MPAAHPLQNDLPLLSDYDKRCIAELGAEFDIDFISLSYTRTGEDVREARRFLDSLGMKDTRIIAKVGGGSQHSCCSPGTTY